MVVCITFACIVITVLNMTSTKKASRDLLLDNIEALAEGENVRQTCWGDGNVQCPIVDVKVAYVRTTYGLK